MGENRRRGRVLAGAVVAGLLGVAFVVVRGAGPAAIGVLYLAAVSARLAATDVRERRLPNALVLPGYAFTAVGAVWAAARGSPDIPVVAAACGVGAVAVFAVLAHGGGTGMGDVKLSGLLAAALAAAVVERAPPGGGGAVAATMVCFAAASLAVMAEGLVGWVAGDPRPGREIAFGPVLLGGFWATAFTW